MIIPMRSLASSMNRWYLLGAVVALPSAVASAQQPAWAGALDSIVHAELARTGTPGAQVAVVMAGRVVYSGAYGLADNETKRPVTRNTLFRVGSVTKMVTAAALTQMAAQGMIDLQAPIGRYVPEIAGKRIANVTTHQLLTHTAGWLDNANAYGRMGEGALGEVFRAVNDTLFFTEPGRVISYSNPGYSMAGFVTEMAGKARFGDIADQLVLKKMGMPRATFRPLAALTHDFSQGHMGPAPVIVRPYTENTAQWAAGFLFASAEELARFTIALMDAGKLDGQQVLAPEAVTMMTTGHVDMPGANGAKYGYGLRVSNEGGERVWQHGGSINGFDAQVTMFPDRKVAVLMFDNRGGAPMRGVIDAAARLAADIAPLPTPAALPDPRDATPAERAALMGTYRNGTVRLIVLEQDGKLMVQQGPQPLAARLVGQDRLVVLAAQGAPTTFLILRDTAGKAEYLHGSLRSLARQP